MDSNQSDKSSCRRTEALQDFIAEFAISTITPLDMQTFHHNNGTSESRIDHIYYNKFAKLMFFYHLCVKNNDFNLSSHNTIIGKLNFNIPTQNHSEIDYSGSYSDFIVKKPRWDTLDVQQYQYETATLLQDVCYQYEDEEQTFIPEMSEMFSKILVKSAQNNSKVSPPLNKNRSHQDTIFSKNLKKAYNEHKLIWEKWRKSGRPQDNKHPTKIAKTESRRRLQKISREEKYKKCSQDQDMLMKTHFYNISQVCSTLKKIRGEKYKSVNIPFIETLCGIYKGDNILEGFRANCEILCNENYDNDTLFLPDF